MDPLLLDLRSALSTDLPDLLERWIAEAQRRCWQLQQNPHLTEELRDRCEAVLSSLAEVLAESSTLQLGDQQFREPVKSLSFVAGWMAGVDLPVGAGLALCHGLQVVLKDVAHPFFQNLEVVVTESYVAGQREKAQATHRQIIRKSQLVCMLSESVAALMLVGDPEREALADAVGRLMMLALMREARHLLVDVSAVCGPDSVVPKALQLLSGHREGLGGRGVRVVLSGLTAQHFERLTAIAPPLELQRFDTIEQGLRFLQISVAASSRG